MKNRHNILVQIRKTVLSVDPAAEIFLFGSQARGDMHQESDWDLLILTDKKKATLGYKTEFYKKLFAIELKNGVVIGALVRNRKDWQALNRTSLYKTIKSEGQPL